MADRIYCYPGTDVLKNKLGIQNPETLMEAEVKFTGNRLLGLQYRPEQGDFGFGRLQRIHKRIFQDLYEWAGQPRTVDIAKGSLFCPAWNIHGYAQDVFRSFYKDCAEAEKDPARFVRTLAAHYADLNALHPFREGNGRAQREFTRELCMECGYVFDLSLTRHKEMLHASRLSLDRGDSTGLERIFSRAVIPAEKYEGMDKKLKSTLMILSADDLPEKPPQKPVQPRRLPKVPEPVQEQDETEYGY